MFEVISEIDAQKKAKDSRENRLLWIMIVSLGLSLGGIMWGIVQGEAHIGQRGGALGVALSFLVLFAGRDTSKKLLNLELPEPNALPNLKPAQSTAIIDSAGSELSEQIKKLQGDLSKTQYELDAVRASISVMLDWGAKEKRYLSVSSVVSTIVWGFGDCVARVFGAT